MLPVVLNVSPRSGHGEAVRVLFLNTFIFFAFAVILLIIVIIYWLLILLFLLGGAVVSLLRLLLTVVLMNGDWFVLYSNRNFLRFLNDSGGFRFFSHRSGRSVFRVDIVKAIP